MTKLREATPAVPLWIWNRDRGLPRRSSLEVACSSLRHWPPYRATPSTTVLAENGRGKLQLAAGLLRRCILTSPRSLSSLSLYLGLGQNIPRPFLLKTVVESRIA